MHCNWTHDHIDFRLVKTAPFERFTQFLNRGHGSWVALPIATDARLAGHGNKELLSKFWQGAENKCKNEPNSLS